MRRIVSIIIAILFLIDNMSFGLSVPNTSNDMDPKASNQTKENMCMLAEAQYLQKIGAGADDEKRKLTKPKKFKNTIDLYEFKMIKTTFLTRRLNKDMANRTEVNPYLEQILPNSDINPIYEIDDIVKAFEYFRDNEAKISKDFLEIKRGYFPMKENTFNPARIEKNPKGSKTPYTLIVHTEFEQMWDHIKANDVWFEKEFENGEKRIISVAWGLFYRIAKHEMTDWRDGGKITKGGGHVHSKQGSGSEKKHGVFKDEEYANVIYGNYSYINDAILLWFMGVYKYSDANRYDNEKFETVVRDFFDRKKEEERRKGEKAIRMDIVFPRLGFSPSVEFEEVLLLGKGINQNFFSNVPYSETDRVKALLAMPEIKVDKKYIDQYEKRKKKNALLDEEAINMFGSAGTDGFPVTFLIVDDERPIRKLMKKKLEMQYPGCGVIVCANGEEGLEALKKIEQGPDIIFTDINMPVMDGIKFLTEFAKIENSLNTKVFVISGLSGNDKRVENVVSENQLDYCGYLAKPFAKDELDKKLTPEVEKIIEKKKEVSQVDVKETAKEDPVVVMILDDEPIISELIRDFLEYMELNIEIVLAGDGKEGMEKVKQMMEEKNRIPEIIITDMRMPHMSGLGFLIEFKRLEGAQDAQIIPMSGFDDDMFDDLPKDINIISRLLKPFTIEKLNDIFAKAFENIVKTREKNNDVVEDGLLLNKVVADEPVTILVVDDETKIQKLIKVMMAKSESAVKFIFANNGQEGLDKINDLAEKNKRPDIIMTDMQMPVMNGLEFLNNLRGLDIVSDTEVFLMSENDYGMYEQLPDEFQELEKLAKPFAITKLRTMLNDAYDKVKRKRKQEDAVTEVDKETQAIEVVSSLDLPFMVGESLEVDQKDFVLTREDKQAVWTSVNMFKEEKIEILLPQSIKLDNEVQNEIVKMNRKYGNIRCERYSTSIVSEEYIGKILADRKREDYERIVAGKKPFKRIVITAPDVNFIVKALAFEGGKPHLFKDVKVLQVNMPKKFLTDNMRLWQHQKLVQIAILTRLYKGEKKTPKVGFVLENIIKKAIRPGLNFKGFMFFLGVEEDDNTTTREIKDRLANLMMEAMVVNFVELIAKEYYFIREFKKYA